MLPVKVFCSYSHRDEKLRDKLAQHLRILEHQGVIESWHDRKISAGTEWAQAIDESLNSADIILLLVSDNFLASDYCYGLEMKRAMERHEAGAVRVVPILLKPVDWVGAPFAKLQAFPKDAKPVTKWSNRDEAFVNITKAIRELAEEIGEALKDRQVIASALTSDRNEKLLDRQEEAISEVAKNVSLEVPEGQVRIDSNFYISSPYETLCYEELEKPGALNPVQFENWSFVSK